MRWGVHRAVLGRALDDGTVPAATCFDTGDLGMHLQFSYRDEFGRGERRVYTRPRESPRLYVHSHPFKLGKCSSDDPLGNVPGAVVWRRHTFSVGVRSVGSELLQKIIDRKMPFLAALPGTPDDLNDILGTYDVLKDAFKFSCMLRGTDTLYRSFVPKLGSMLHLGLVELMKPCRCIKRGEVDRVGTTVFPGLFEVLPARGLGVQTVVPRAQVICECELATRDVGLKPQIPHIPLPTI